jgi:hypothetical protein
VTLALVGSTAYTVGAQKKGGNALESFRAELNGATNPAKSVCVCTQRGMEGRAGRLRIQQRGVARRYLEVSCEIPLFDAQGGQDGAQPCTSFRPVTDRR